MDSKDSCAESADFAASSSSNTTDTCAKKHCAAGKFPNAARIESIREVDSDLYYIDCTRFPFGGLLIELKACGDEKNHAYLMIVMSVAEDHEQSGIVQTDIPAI